MKRFVSIVLSGLFLLLGTVYTVQAAPQECILKSELEQFATKLADDSLRARSTLEKRYHNLYGWRESTREERKKFHAQIVQETLSRAATNYIIIGVVFDSYYSICPKGAKFLHLK